MNNETIFKDAPVEQVGAIYACDRRGGIGYRGGLVVSSKADIEHFWSTIGQDVVIVGSKTWEGAKRYFLKRRPEAFHVVLTSDTTDEGWNIIKVDTPFQAILKAKNFAAQNRVWICGGGYTYEALEPYTDFCLVTATDIRKEPCDTFISGRGQLLKGKVNIVKIKDLEKLRDTDDSVSVYRITREG